VRKHDVTCGSVRHTVCVCVCVCVYVCVHVCVCVCKTCRYAHIFDDCNETVSALLIYFSQPAEKRTNCIVF